MIDWDKIFNWQLIVIGVSVFIAVIIAQLHINNNYYISELHLSIYAIAMAMYAIYTISYLWNVCDDEVVEQ